MASKIRLYEKRELLKKVKEIISEFKKRNGVEIYGKLEIEIIEDKSNQLAFLKGNKIFLSIKCKRFPKYVLKYILAHEIAHLIVKKHTRKFWEIVKQIYPNYEKGKSRLSSLLKQKII